jgi:hypothetical protein
VSGRLRRGAELSYKHWINGSCDNSHSGNAHVVFVANVDVLDSDLEVVEDLGHQGGYKTLRLGIV